MYTFDSRVRYSETDPDGMIKIGSIIDYFQDCSTFQSEDLGIGLEYLGARHIAWLVNYWQIDILERPALGDRIVTGTSPYELKGFLGLRNFMMEKADGTRLVNANSVWVLMDMEKGLPARTTKEITDAYELSPKFEMEYLPRKIRLQGDSGEEMERIEVTESYLDSNHHVNNGQYVRMALRYIPETGQKIRRLRVEYRKQAKLHDLIIPVLYRESDGQMAVSLNGEDGTAYAVVELQYTLSDSCARKAQQN